MGDGVVKGIEGLRVESLVDCCGSCVVPFIACFCSAAWLLLFCFRVSQSPFLWRAAKWSCCFLGTRSLAVIVSLVITLPARHTHCFQRARR